MTISDRLDRIETKLRPAKASEKLVLWVEHVDTLVTWIDR
jgi:hypothetical protein